MNGPLLGMTVDELVSVLGWIVAVASLAITMRRYNGDAQKSHDKQVAKSEHLAGQMSSLSKSIDRLQRSLDHIDDTVTADRQDITRIQEQVKTLFERLGRLEHSHDELHKR